MGVHGGPDIVTDDLIALWDAADGASYTSGSSAATWTDLSGYGHHMTLNLQAMGGVSSSLSDQPNGGTIAFPGGADSYATITVTSAVSMGTGGFTVSAWAKGKAQEAYARLFYFNWAAPANGFALNPYGAGWRFEEFGGQSANSSISTQDSVWHNPVGVRDGDNIYIYVDGKLEGTDSGLADSDFGTAAPNVKQFAHPASQHRFHGEVGCASMYGRALSAKEILQNFNAHRGRFGV